MVAPGFNPGLAADNKYFAAYEPIIEDAQTMHTPQLVALAKGQPYGATKDSTSLLVRIVRRSILLHFYPGLKPRATNILPLRG